jgi:alkylation response protein AidB-like acyl-CoA dehydrogenase
MKMLSKEEDDLIAEAGRFARDVVAPGAVAWERERRLGREGILAAAGIGLTRISVPAAHGGLGYSFTCKAGVAEALAGADFGFTMSLINTQNIAQKLALHAPAELAAAYVPDLIAGRRIGCTALTEPGAGSDFAAITTMAVPFASGWRLDGSKAWITNASEADVIILYAQTEAGAGARGIAGFLVDASRPGFLREPAYGLAGQHAIGTGGFRLEGYVARSIEMLQEPGRAFKAAMTDINAARVYIAAMCCGMLAECWRIVVDYGRKRMTFGRPLDRNQGWRWRLVEAATDLAAAQALVTAAAAQIDAGEDAQLSSAQAKLLATAVAERHIAALTQAMGAEGLRESYPFGRHLIGARVAGYVDGSSEMLLERAARLLIG